jgi:DNA repair exonuclease SbcCD ATPase subunit
MKYNNPFIKVTWEDVTENFTPERINRVKSYFQEKYNTKHVKVITKTLTQIQNTKLKSLEVSDNILDPNYQKSLMKDFIDENKIGIKWDLIDRLDNKVNEELGKKSEVKVRYNKWFIKRIEFSNFLSYGDDNTIVFEQLPGITLIESNPRNFGGKSVIGIDLLTFLFFGTTTKTKTNSEIFNKFRDKNELSVRGEIVIDGEEYTIERSLHRKASKSGDFNVTSKLEFNKKKSDGTFENLTGEQRRETEQFISSAIGSQEDFMATILTTGYNIEELIESKPTARGQVLMKFMGLENLRTKEEVAREIYNEWSRKLVSSIYNMSQLKIDNEKYELSKSESQTEIGRLNNSLIEFEKSLKSYEIRRDEILASRNTDIDKEVLNINPILLQREIDTEKEEKAQINKRIGEIIVQEPSEFYLEESHENVKKEISNISLEIKLLKNEIDRQNIIIKNFQEGKQCHVCKSILDKQDHTEEINEITKVIEELEGKILGQTTNLGKLQVEVSHFDQLKKIYDEYERNKLRREKLMLEHGQKELSIGNKENKIKNFELNKKKIEENQKIDVELMTLRTKIETARGDINQSSTNITRHTGNITTMNEKISTNNELMKKIKQEEEYAGTFKIYLSIYGKNGISKVIMKNMIPLLNQELQRLLSDSAPFILELNINEKNEVEFIMIDTETRIVKPLNAGSGYERTISSLALRSVLTKISTLPKPNIVVMDEVFGKIADENLEMVGEFFKKIKNYFEHIVVISHNPLIRNWSDNLITIQKEENISSIESVVTKLV